MFQLAVVLAAVLTPPAVASYIPLSFAQLAGGADLIAVGAITSIFGTVEV